jgi:hypothetical protein
MTYKDINIGCDEFGQPQGYLMGFQLKSCKECGAYVENTEAHDRFHENLERK